MKNNSLIIMIAIVFAVTIAALIIRVCFLDKYTEEKVPKE